MVNNNYSLIPGNNINSMEHYNHLLPAHTLPEKLIRTPLEQIPASPNIVGDIIGKSVQAKMSYWFGYGISWIGLSQGIPPLDFARFTCISSIIRPEISDGLKKIFGCKGDDSWRDLTELFGTAIATNLIGVAVSKLVGSNIDAESLLRNALWGVSFSILSKQLNDLVKNQVELLDETQNPDMLPEGVPLTFDPGYLQSFETPLKIETDLGEIITFEN